MYLMLLLKYFKAWWQIRSIRIHLIVWSYCVFSASFWTFLKRSNTNGWVKSASCVCEGRTEAWSQQAAWNGSTWTFHFYLSITLILLWFLLMFFMILIKHFLKWIIIIINYINYYIIILYYIKIVLNFFQFFSSLNGILF